MSAAGAATAEVPEATPGAATATAEHFAAAPKPPPSRAGTEKPVRSADAGGAGLHPDRPDPSPVPLPEGLLACAVCGTATAEPPSGARTLERWYGPRPLPHLEVPLSRCAECERMRALAAEVVDAHPALAASRGSGPALLDVEGALTALRLVGAPLPAPDVSDADLGLLVRRLAGLGRGSQWAAAVRPGHHDRAAPYPFAHLDAPAPTSDRYAAGGGQPQPMAPGDPLEPPHRQPQRAGLRAAYALVLKERAARGAPPLDLEPPPPSPPGCLFCGVGTVALPAAEVERRGGRTAAARSVWSPRTTTPGALGGRGPGLVSGCLCPPCADAVASVGAVGPSAMERALIRSLAPDLSGSSRLDAVRMRDLVGWGAGPPLPPNAEPWQHCHGLAPLRDEVRRLL